MEGSEFTQIRSKRGVEENIEARSKEDYDVQVGVDKKHKSSKSRKHSDVEEVDEQENDWRKASDVRNESKKRSGGASIITSGDEDDYSVRSAEVIPIQRSRGEIWMRELRRDLVQTTETENQTAAERGEMMEMIGIAQGNQAQKLPPWISLIMKTEIKWKVRMMPKMRNCMKEIPDILRGRTAVREKKILVRTNTSNVGDGLRLRWP